MKSSPELQQVVEEGAGEHVQDPDLSRPERIQEEEELPHGGADVKGVKGFLQPVQLGQSLYQLQDVVFYKN